MIKETNVDTLISEIIDGIEDVKGLDIKILDLREIENTVTQYFVICNGNSNTQVTAIVNSVQKTVSKEIKDKKKKQKKQKMIMFSVAAIFIILLLGVVYTQFFSNKSKDEVKKYLDYEMNVELQVIPNNNLNI